MRRLWILSGVFILSFAVGITGYYYSTYEEQMVGHPDRTYCKVTVFEDLDNLEKRRYSQSNISISGVEELRNQDFCPDLGGSKMGNLTELITLNISNDPTRRYYRNEADEIIGIEINIAT